MSAALLAEFIMGGSKNSVFVIPANAGISYSCGL